MANEAAWIPAAKAQLIVKDETETPTPTPSEGEVLVKVKSIAFSPIESKIQKFGTHPIPYPSILGTSFAGTIEAVPSASPFKVGDNVAVNRTSAHLGDPRFGAFQKYALASTSSLAVLPPSVDLVGAGASILNLAAVVSALHIHLGLPLPPVSLPSSSSNTVGQSGEKKKKVLVYGGSSSCGGLAVRYLLTAGIDVVTTSSPQNNDFVASLGKDLTSSGLHIIDHKASKEEIIEALGKNGPYDAVFDSIGLPPVTDIVSTYLDSVGGGSYNTLIPHMGEKPVPESVERKFAAYSWAFDEEKWKDIRDWFYGEYMTKGLESGVVVPTRVHEIEGGLAKVQEALDLMLKGGVSGRKLVMDPWA